MNADVESQAENFKCYNYANDYLWFRLASQKSIV